MMRIAFVGLSALAVLADCCAGAEAQRRIQVQGEMGTGGMRPGNTLPSFESAIAAGADAIEMDMQVTKDNVIVISHDPILHPPYCTGPKPDAAIHELTLAEIRQWDCGAALIPGFPRQQAVPGTRMPTLDEVFALAGRGKFLFNIETKITPRRLTLELSCWLPPHTQPKQPQVNDGDGPDQKRESDEVRGLNHRKRPLGTVHRVRPPRCRRAIP